MKQRRRPNSADITQLEARRLHRIAIPLSVAKDLSGKILVGIQHWENEYGINLPLETTRQISKEDN